MQLDQKLGYETRYGIFNTERELVMYLRENTAAWIASDASVETPPA